MTIDWLHFTPWSALAGGTLIGLAASLFVVFNGRIAGISGLLGSLLCHALQGVFAGQLGVTVEANGCSVVYSAWPALVSDSVCSVGNLSIRALSWAAA